MYSLLVILCHIERTKESCGMRLLTFNRTVRGWSDCSHSATVSIPPEGGGGGGCVNSDLEVVVAGQGDEEVEQEALAVLKHLDPVVVQT